MSIHSPNIFTFEDRGELGVAVADAMTDYAAGALARKGSANLLLSGGSTPIQAYREFSQKNLDWKNVHMGLVDERWIPPEHKDSNEGMIRREMTSLACKNLISMWEDTESPFNAVEVIANRYSHLLDIDVLVLGMGLDGHTASWFPNSKGVDKAMDVKNKFPIAGIDASNSSVAGNSPLRITLTLSALKKAKQVILMIFGQEKWGIFQSALNGDQETLDLPITLAIRALGNVMSVYFAK